MPALNGIIGNIADAIKLRGCQFCACLDTAADATAANATAAAAAAAAVAAAQA